MGLAFLFRAVGVRWGTVPLANLPSDQRTVIGLLARIPVAEGGQREAWPPRLRPEPGQAHQCPPALAEAIWTFQRHWKARGVFRVIDGAVDPGMNTLRKLNELATEPALPRAGALVCRTHRGPPHRHLAPDCLSKEEFHRIDSPLDPTLGADGRVSHVATPLNPRRTGRMISVGGAMEVAYLGFEDYVPDPARNPNMPASMVARRPFLHTLRDDSVSDVCFRSVPLDRYNQGELRRICMLGARLTFATNLLIPRSHIERARSFGPLLEYANFLAEPGDLGGRTNWHVFVVHMLWHRLERR